MTATWCAHTIGAPIAQAVLFWPVCALLLLVVFVAAIDGRKNRQALKAVRRREARLEQSLKLERGEA